MHLTGRDVIIESPGGLNARGFSFNGKTGQILMCRWDVVKNRVAFLVRVEEKMEVFYHDELRLSPEDVSQMDEDADTRRKYLISPGS